MSESVHVGVRVQRSAAEVFAYVRDGKNLPDWAAGVTEGAEVSFVPDNPYGVADHDVALPDGTTIRVPLRVLADGDG